MIEFETLQMLVYQHVVQLTLQDHAPRRAFQIAHRVAAAAFDETFTRAGLNKARDAAEKSSATLPDPDQEDPKLEQYDGQSP